MYPILVDWGWLVIPAWHFFYAVGAIGAYVMLVWLGRKFEPEIPESILARLFIVCYLAGYAGARYLSILVEEPDVRGLGPTLAAMFRFGPMTFYGGAIGAFVGGLVYVRRRGLSVARLMDLAIPAGLTALVLGRIGCFLNGDDYGLPIGPSHDGAPWWAVTFPNLKDDIARYPVQLWEALTVALLVVGLIWGFKRARTAFRPGIVGFLGIVIYANLRFGLEFFRGDLRGFVLGDWLSTSQFISIVVLAIAGLSIPVWIRSESNLSD
jgi:phosphatidylglycerol:prolipoprotein diacylglycerol transferase